MNKLIVASLALLFSAQSFTMTASIQEQIKALLSGRIMIDDIADQRVFSSIRGGDIIGNGGGLVETQFKRAFYNMGDDISQCLESHSCYMDEKDRDLLKKIQSSLKTWPKGNNKLIFLSGKQYPAFFTSNEVAPRTAITGTRKHSPIFINNDHLYDYRSGKPTIKYPEVLSLLLHELGHHEGIKNHSYLSSLGNSLSKFVTKNFMQIESSLIGAEMMLMAVNSGPSHYSQLWWTWNGLEIDFTQEIKSLLYCSQGRTPIGKKIENLSWKRTISSPRKWKIGFMGWLTVYCRDEVGTVWDEFLDFNGGHDLLIGRNNSTITGPWIELVQ